MLVTSGILRYQSAPPASSRVWDVLDLPEGHDALAKRENLTANLLLAAVAVVTLGGAGLAGLSAEFTDSALAPASIIIAMAAAVGVLIWGSFHYDLRSAIRERAASVEVPSGVADAFRRIRSAAREIESAHQSDESATIHSPETLATARLTLERSRELVALLADHHTAGTFHTAPAQVLADETYRLAAEMDAYLTVVNTDRFAPAEDEALALLSATSQFTFAPTSTAEGSPTP